MNVATLPTTALIADLAPNAKSLEGYSHFSADCTSSPCTQTAEDLPVAAMVKEFRNVVREIGLTDEIRARTGRCPRS